MGFPGGVAWAMMVANICQSYPQACGSVVVGKFFHLMNTWNWPRPVMLKEIDENPPGMHARIWNPMVSLSSLQNYSTALTSAQVYRGDQNHLMPIITPAYPSMCATHNITRSTMKVIRKELERGTEIVKSIYDGKMQWKDLFQRHTFFTTDYKYYLSIVSASKTKEAQLIWSGLVESKVRRLVSSIEDSQPGISLARPFTRGFDRTHQYRTQEELDQILHGKLDFLILDSKNTNMGNDATHTAAAQGNAENMEMPKTEDDKKSMNETNTATVWTTTYYIGIELAEGSKSLDISFSVKDFQRLCTSWPQYNPDLNSVRVIHTRNYDLPDDVFELGDLRPSKAKKAKTLKPPESTSKKRSFTESALEVSVLCFVVCNPS